MKKYIGFILKLKIEKLKVLKLHFSYFTFLIFAFNLFIIPAHSIDAEIKTQNSKNSEKNISVNFQDVSMLEFLRFVSKVSEVNFIYDENILDFKVSLVTGKAVDKEMILKIMTEFLNQKGIKTEKKDGYVLVRKMSPWETEGDTNSKLVKNKISSNSKTALIPINNKNSELSSFDNRIENKDLFHVYKLQYHQGVEILSAIKNVSNDLTNSNNPSTDLVKTIGSMQWVESTNSILYSGTQSGINQLTSLINTLDVPKKQVFIEVLVIETDVKNGQEFGLEWGGGGKYKDKIGYGLGGFPSAKPQTPFSKTLQSIDNLNTPTGTAQFPIGRGFDLGIIGDIILHKGKSYFSLGSLVSALETQGNSTIILNQKIITQDNKQSSIFVGDNIPFTGSVVETVGAAQQTSSNIEYRDVGVKLNITPLLGDENVITLDIAEEITEVVPDISQNQNSNHGIQTTKTDMTTQVHVPDQSFLVLSGMIRNSKRQHRSGPPCLGGIPLLGAAFSKTITNEEKRNVIVFVRPQIVYNNIDHKEITAYQQSQIKNESEDPDQYQKGIDMINEKGNINGTIIPSSKKTISANKSKEQLDRS